MRFESSATVSLGFRIEDIPTPREGSAGLPELAARAREQIRAILGISAAPLVSRVFRWPEANPIYEVGHEARVRELVSRLPAGLHLCGASYRGIGVPDCVREGGLAAKRVLARMT